ncbi:hypothetical protein KIN20_017788 [Parelaphostrongylus tenuis]|uniref:Uncharacterized protein n=1 Tax=Parelaphostrongylus tenuis TaxID=148309 RepID=A0AAD5N186_PARTN|nr:hypothetical protein KIN20_017788 [Parelaphostrongylus tenuis]
MSGFRLPTSMVFTSSASAPIQLPGGIATTSDAAKLFVSRLVMQAIMNIIMANLYNTMWQGVVNRAVRMLAAGPFASHFVSAFATVS